MLCNYLFEVVIILQDENRKLEEERDSAKSQVDLLHGDLGVTQVESTKEEKKWEVGCLQVTYAPREYIRNSVVVLMQRLYHCILLLV